MASTKDISPQPTVSNVQEDEKLTRSLRSIISFLTLGAWLGILAGIFMIWSMAAYKLGFSALFSIVISFASAAALFRCTRLLEQKSQLAITVYTAFMIGSWSAVLIMRVVNSQPLFRLTDLLSLILPGAILFGMYGLKQKGFLV